MKTLDFTAAAVLVVLVFYLLSVGQSLLLPLVIAIALWYLINTLARTFYRVRVGDLQLPMPVCLLASIFTFMLVIWGLVNFFSGRVQEVIEVLPVYQANLTTRIESLPFVDVAAVQEQGLMQIVTGAIDFPSYATSLAADFASIVASGGLILIYILFLFLEQGNFPHKISALVNDEKREKDVRRILSQVRDDIQKYISIKMFTSSLTGILSYIVLRILGVDFAGVWGLLIFLLNFIPTIGSIIATIFPALIALAQSDGYTLVLLVLIGIGALQVCIGNIIEPRMMGSSFNLSPIIILLNLALWGYIWGIPGMFLCVPILIIITITLSHFPRTRPIAIILSSDGNLKGVLDSSLENFSFSVASNDLLPGSDKEDDS